MRQSTIPIKINMFTPYTDLNGIHYDMDVFKERILEVHDIPLVVRKGEETFVIGHINGVESYNDAEESFVLDATVYSGGTAEMGNLEDDIFVINNFTAVGFNIE